MSKKIDELEKQLIPEKEFPVFWPGDDVAVHVRIKEGEKERVQVLNGMCIGKQGSGRRETFTVRKVSYGEGVERTFMLYSPSLVKIEIMKSRKNNRMAPRAKMYYTREKN
mgnify:CR=1 FL=1